MNTENYMSSDNNIERKKAKINDIRTLFGLSEYLTNDQIKNILNKGYEMNQELTDRDIIDLGLVEIQAKKINEYEKVYFDIGFHNRYSLQNGKAITIQEEKINGGEKIAFDGNIDYYVEIEKGSNGIGVSIKGKEDLPKEIYRFAEKGKGMVIKQDEILIDEQNNYVSIPKDIGFCKGYKTDIASQVLKDKLIQILGTPEKIKDNIIEDNEIAR